MNRFTKNMRYMFILFYCISILFTISCSKSGVNEEETFAERESVYDAKNEIEESLKRLKEDKKAYLINDINTVENIVSITFEGLSDRKTTDKLLDLLDKHGVQSIFFVPGIKSAEDPENIKNIVNRGQKIGNFTLNANKEMHRYSNTELVEDFSRTNVILSQISGEIPKYLKCNVTKYNDEILKSASASGLEAIIDNKRFLNYQSFSSKEDAKHYVKGIEKGAIISIKVDSVLDQSEYGINKPQEEKLDDKEVVKDFQQEIEKKDMKSISKGERLIKNIDMLLSALKEEDYKIIPIDQFMSHEDADFNIDFNKMRQSNNGVLAPVITNINTTQKDLTLTFRYINDEEMVSKVLDTLDKKGTKATFIVTGNEIIEYEKRIQRILERGHAVANGGMNNDVMTEKSFNQVAFAIYKCDKLLKDKFGVEGNLFMPAYGQVNDTVLEAASALNHIVVTYNKNPITNEKMSIKEILKYFENKFRRGDILYFRLDLYQNLDKVLEKIVNRVEKSNYGFESVENLYSNRFETRPLKNIPGWDAVKITKDYDSDLDSSEKVINTIPVETKTVFITFDDWGMDPTITNILDILNKYGVKASFFLRVDGVDLNPNLARAISEAGHDIGNHTYSHEEIPNMSPEDLLKDIVKGHQSLTKAINRQPELLFRPPRLITDNTSLNAILASGFEYIVIGDINTHDYKLPANEVVENVLNNVQPGSIIVMHLNDTASASEALPIIIEKLREQGYNFGKLSQYLN